MNPVLAKLPKGLRAKLKKQKMPSFEQPMLATLTKSYFSSKDWIFERKFDGARCLSFKNGTTLALKSRNDKKIDKTYPELAQAIGELAIDQIILDGEIITFEHEVSSFEKLQARLGVKNPSAALIKRVKIYYYVFDILYLDGYDLTDLPLITRKSILKKVIAFKDPIRFVIHQNSDGEKFFKQACKKGWEGLIAKRKTGTYVHVRSKDWLKFKCTHGQELVVGGFTEPRASRTGFGALLLGYYQGKDFIFAGKVGTGFSDEFLEKFGRKLKSIEIKKSPFKSLKGQRIEGVHFVKPLLVAEIGFEEWTKQGLLRQARFQGIRDDKNAHDVVKEVPHVIQIN
jgi:bifunctional non-homologous end joining protein LigD